MANLGGVRKGAGRPKGVTSKLSGQTILATVEKICGAKFEVLLAEGYYKSIIEDDWNARLTYEKMILSKVVADKHEIDHTTLGKSMQVQLVFNQQELPEWGRSVPLTMQQPNIIEMPIVNTIETKC